MGRENAFINGFEKRAENWWSLLKKPFQRYAAASKSPGHQLKKALGLGVIGTGAGLYGINKVLESPDDQAISQMPYNGMGPR
jgi:hypothetical protein